MKIIYIRKMRYDEASNKLDREIQEAFMAGETLVEVVHGLGEGKLKSLTLEYVKANDFLKVYDTSLYIQPNPGITRIEILTPSKDFLKKIKK
jgi:CTP-dependent riboflavin kinase